MRNCIDLPLALPKHKRARSMAQAEYIANRINEDINAHRNESFDNFAIEVRIYPVPSAAELYDKKGIWVGFSQYVFDAFGREPKTMFVTVDYKWNVRIKYLGAWRPISAYLKNLKPHNVWDDTMSKQDIMHRRWRQQADWWKENGKVFPFMQLPAEIREMVCEHYWGSFIEPYPSSSARKLTNMDKISKKLQTPSRNLLLTCRLINAEASDILYLRTTFVFEHYGVLKAFTMKVEQRNTIRHLELAFSHDEFMNLFRTDHIRRDRKAKTEVVGLGWPALALRSMTLSSLRMVIAPPSLVTKSGKFDDACQRKAVDMIMEAAWPVIRGHPLELVGYIKDTQKKIYEARDVLERKRVQHWRGRRLAWGLEDGTLEQYYDELDEEVGGVPLDGSRPEVVPEKMEVVEEEERLKCRCDPQCAEDTWTPWD